MSAGSSYDLRNAIYGSLDSIKPGSLSFWGDWFGHPYDNVHRLVGADGYDDIVVLYFDHGESIIITKPDSWSLKDGRLIIGNAQAVRFQWFYYGELPSPKSLRFLEYRRNDSGELNCSSDTKFGGTELDPAKPAVQLHASPTPPAPA